MAGRTPPRAGTHRDFVAVEGARTLLMPDRPGNNRVDSFHNLMANPKVGLLFSGPWASAFAAGERHRAPNN